MRNPSAVVELICEWVHNAAISGKYMCSVGTSVGTEIISSS